MLTKWKLASALPAFVVTMLMVAAPSQADVVPADNQPAQQSTAWAIPPVADMFSLNAGIDIPTMYIFRGIAQQNQGFMAQPYAYLSAKILDQGAGHKINSHSVVFGFWNSIHSEPSPAATQIDQWYETDLSIGSSTTFCDKWTFDFAYLAYMSPSDSFNTIHEIDLKLAFDDAGLWPKLGEWEPALKPYVLFAFELANPDRVNANGNRTEGTYVELGINPSYVVQVSSDYPVTLSLPVAVGLSLDNYYPDPANGNRDEGFGFAVVGFRASTPLPFIPKDLGTWNAYAQIQVFFLGDGAAHTNGPTGLNVTGGSDIEPVGMFGLSVAYP